MAGGLSVGTGPAPQLLVLLGLPGAGKSTLARALAAGLSAEHVDRDALRPAGTPLPSANTEANLRQLQRLAAALAAGRSAIADGRCLATAGAQAPYAELARRAGVPLRWLWLDLPLAEAQRRVVASAARHPAPDRDAALVARIAAALAPPRAAIRLDARQPPAQLLAQALAALQASACSTSSATRSPEASAPSM